MKYIYGIGDNSPGTEEKIYLDGMYAECSFRDIRNTSSLMYLYTIYIYIYPLSHKSEN